MLSGLRYTSTRRLHGMPFGGEKLEQEVLELGAEDATGIAEC
jgi:hypothetical protein